MRGVGLEGRCMWEDLFSEMPMQQGHVRAEGVPVDGRAVF